MAAPTEAIGGGRSAPAIPAAVSTTGRSTSAAGVRWVVNAPSAPVPTTGRTAGSSASRSVGTVMPTASRNAPARFSASVTHDTPHRIGALLPELGRLVDRGLVVREEPEVLTDAAGRDPRPS